MGSPEPRDTTPFSDYLSDDLKDDKPSLLIADKLSPLAEEQLQIYCNVIADPKLTEATLIAKMKEVNPTILVVRSTLVTKEHIHAAPNLALIVRAGAGTNTIDVKEASIKGIYVANCPGKNAIAVAELTLGLIINLDRRISDNVISLREGKWNKKEFSKANGLKGRTLSIIGVGTIGKEVIKRARSFGMIIKAWSRSLTIEEAKKLKIEYCATPIEACTNSDVLSVHLAYCNDTKNFVNKNILSVLKDGAYIINTSRGGIINEKDLLELIGKKKFRVGLDVYENEPEANDNEFKDKLISGNNNIYGTHHIGASTTEASEAVAKETVDIIKSWIIKGTVPNCVNLEKQTPAKYLLSVRHQDKVGVLAHILETLKTEGINVQEMENIVFEGAQSACARFGLDTKPKNEAIDKIVKHEFIYSVKIIKKR